MKVDAAICWEPGKALGVPLPERTAQPLAVLLHHRVENLTTRIDAQLEEGIAGVRQGSQERKRDFNECFRGFDDLEVVGLLGMLRHGGSFVVRYPLRTTRKVKEPPLSIPYFNRFWECAGQSWR